MRVSFAVTSLAERCMPRLQPVDRPAQVRWREGSHAEQDSEHDHHNQRHFLFEVTMHETCSFTKQVSRNLVGIVRSEGKQVDAIRGLQTSPQARCLPVENPVFGPVHVYLGRPAE